MDDGLRVAGRAGCSDHDRVSIVNRRTASETAAFAVRADDSGRLCDSDDAVGLGLGQPLIQRKYGVPRVPNGAKCVDECLSSRQVQHDEIAHNS
jgi:hypothetical protein